MQPDRQLYDNCNDIIKIAFRIVFECTHNFLSCPKDTHATVSYLQQEAAFIDCAAHWKALFPGFKVRGCCAGDVLPGGLILGCYKTYNVNDE